MDTNQLSTPTYSSKIIIIFIVLLHVVDYNYYEIITFRMCN